MSWNCKWLAIEVLIFHSFIGLGIELYTDLKTLHILLPYLSIVFNFSGDWAGGYKYSKKKEKTDDNTDNSI